MLIVGAATLRAAPPNHIEPADVQLQATIKAFEALGWQLNVRASEQTGPSFSRANVSDDDLINLPDVPFSFGLELYSSNLSDKGMKLLSDFKNLSSLTLSGNNVTDTKLKEIAKLGNLRSLYLMDTDVTEAGESGLHMVCPTLEMFVKRPEIVYEVNLICCP